MENTTLELDYVDYVLSISKSIISNNEIINFSNKKNDLGVTNIDITKADGSVINIIITPPIKKLTIEERDYLIITTFDKNPRLSSYKIGLVAGCCQSTVHKILKKYHRIRKSE